jgi:sugar lactone lactonase YvrE
MKTTAFLHHQVITGALCAGAVLLAAGASAQTLYEADLYTGAINVFNSSGAATTFVPSTESLGQEIAFNSSGYLFVANNRGPSITEISPNGTVSSFGSGFSQPSGVAVNSAGDVFVANEATGQIFELSPNGSTETVFASGLDDPAYLAFDSAGNLFESDWGSGDIYEFATDKTKTLFASGFQKPVGLAIDGAGDVYVANTVGGDVLEVTSTGIKTVLSGLDDPQGLALNNAGDLFVAVPGPNNGYIEEVTSSGATMFSTQVATPYGLAFAPVPEPSTLALLAMGASAVILRLRRNNKNVGQN